MFENKKIFILGMARSGYNVAKLLYKNNEIVITDKNDQDEEKVKELESLGVKFIKCDNPLEIFNDSFDMVIKNPGVMPTHPLLTYASSKNIPIYNEMEVAYHFLPKNITIIGVTGSNGKTTTTTMIYELLKLMKKPVVLGGNIGYPLTSFLDKLEDNDIIVMEVSCQQLENMSEFKPHIALMTNLSVAHVDFLKSYENYKRVKLKLFKNQTANDIAILNIENDEVIDGTKDIKATTKYFSSKREINGAYYKDNALWYYGEKILDRDKFLLAGNHNVENALGAMMIAKEVGVDNESIVKVLTTFKGVAHRLEFVDEIDGVKYYNDTEATNTKCTQIALNSFNCDIVLILGGLERGQNFHDLDKYMGNVKEIVGIGQCRNRVKEYGTELNINTQIFETLDEAMDYINEIKQSGEVVLLSPASASWDQYKQCEDRGDEFKEKIRKMRENS